MTNNEVAVPMSDEEFARKEAQWAVLTTEMGPEWRRRKRMSLDAFTAYLATFPTMAAELIPVRRHLLNRNLEFGFIPRPQNDKTPEYAGRLHTPGCMVMPWRTINEAFREVVEREVGCEFETLVELPANEGNDSPRGFEVPIARIGRFKGVPRADARFEWFSIEKIELLYEADAIIRAQVDSFILRAAQWARENEDQITWN